MFDRFRIWFSSVTGRSSGTRRISRREREESQRRLLIIGISITAIVLVVVLSAGAFYQYIYFPGQTLAAVNGQKIKRTDYWKVRKMDLINQAAQYTQIAQYTTGDQATQYQTLAKQAQAQLKTVESDPIDADTLKQMVDNIVVLDGLSDLNLSISQTELDQYQAQQFVSAPIGSPTPTLPIDPTAAAWATATAEEQATASAEASASAAAAAGTPNASPTGSETPVATESPSATESAAATATASESSSTAATPSASETANGTPSASPEAGTPTEAASPTVSESDARATAAANLQQYSDNVLKQAGMSIADFRRLVLKPDLARQKVSDKLQGEVSTRATQIHVEHILVATEDAANSIVNNDLKDKSFEEVAKAQSADTTTAPNGGDLGWIPQGVMTPEFDNVAFGLKAGEVSQPFKTKWGWEIVKVLEREEDRPITSETLTVLRTNKLNDWLDTARSKDNIDWNIGAAIPSPTPETQFTAPPDAPPTPTPLPTPTPTPSPPGTPGAGTPGAETPTP